MSNTTKEGFTELKGKFNYRQFFMFCVLICITAAEILFDYVKAGFNPSIFYDAAYWVRLAITCISVVLVTLTVRDFFREKELASNASVARVQGALDDAHAELLKYDLMTRFEAYIAIINDERKLKAYKAHLQYKMFKAKGKRKERYAKLLETAAEATEFLPTIGRKIRVSWCKWVRYNKASVTTIFARAGKSQGDDEDLYSNEDQEVRQILFRKLMPIVALSTTVATLFFDNGAFAASMLINTFLKLFRLGMAMYTGMASGQDFVKTTLLGKMERRLEFVQKFLEKEKAVKNTAHVNE